MQTNSQPECVEMQCLLTTDMRHGMYWLLKTECFGGTRLPSSSRGRKTVEFSLFVIMQVNDFLQVEGHPNWFAIGDITSLSDYRLGRLAQDQGKLAAGQIKALQHGGKLKVWKKHNGLEVIIVSLGRNDGAAAAWGWGWSGWLPTVMKSRDLLVGMTRKNLGLPKA